MASVLTETVRAVCFTISTLGLFAFGYHGLIWTIGQVAFPVQAEGSLVRRPDGQILGSTLIAQAFQGDGYLYPRPSAVDFNAASTGGSNLSATNPVHAAAVAERVEAITAREGVPATAVPADLVTTSGAGLDPHISPAAADLQAARVARARGLRVTDVREVIRNAVEPPLLGVFGQPRVNVLELNLSLDRRFGTPARLGGTRP